MYFFLYGEDTYSIKEKVRAFRAKFNNDSNALFNHIRLDGAKLTKANYLEAVLSLPFLMETKLVEITNLLMENKDLDLKKYIAYNLDKIPQSSVVLFIEEGLPDARTVLFKTLDKPKIAQTFSPLPRSFLQRWIRARVDKAKLTISQQAVEKLILFVDADLWRLDQETNKLIAYAGARGVDGIDEKSVELMVAPNSEVKIFDLIDWLAKKNEKESIQALHRLIEAGENEIYILTMIVYQFRHALSAADLRASGAGDQEILKLTRINPYVFRKLATLLRIYPLDKLESIYLKLEQADYELKSGSVPGLVLDLLVVDICRM